MKDNEDMLQEEQKKTTAQETAKKQESAEHSEVKSEEKKEKNIKSKKVGMKASFHNQQFKSGAYSSFVTILVIALVVILNLVFAKLDLSTDLSTGSLYTLTKDTKQVIKAAKDPVRIYYMVKNGNQQDNISRALKQYNKISSRCQVITKDPVVYPEFGKQFGISNDISDNDVIVVNQRTKVAKYISNSDMYYSESSDYYNSSSSSGEQYLDVEGKVTSAIQYVLSDKGTKMYVLSGHKELSLGDTLTAAIEKMNVGVKKLNMMKKGSIPKDCDILLINGPTTDLLSEEKKQIISYLKAGGDAIILTEYTTEKMTNFNAVLKEYGVQVQKGIIFEGAGKYYEYQQCVIPSVGQESSITSSLQGNILMMNAQGLKTEKSSALRSTLTMKKLLSSSKKSYLKVKPNSKTLAKTANDISGPFTLGLYIQDKLSAKNSTKMVVYSSADLLYSSYTETSSLENASLLKNAVNAMVKSSGKLVSVDKKSLSYSYLSMQSQSQILWTILLVILLPLALLIAGFSIWMMRRRK
jgi:ABC-2 type transport system permease protein